MKGKLIKTDVNFLLEDDKGVVIASTSLNKEGLSLSQKNCQAIELGYDLDELADEWVFETNGHKWSNNDNTAGDNYRSFKEGFQKALELMSDKIFTLDDMYTVFIMGREGMEDKMNRYVTRIHEPIEWDVEIETVPALSNNGNVYYGDIPKLDATGCLILKRI